MNQACRRGANRGSILVAALVCLTIIVAMIGSMLVAALAASRQMRTERDFRQCELLLAAGIDRAAYRLASERSYRGETWNVSADRIAGSGEGNVTIKLTSNPEQNSQQIQITAEYPAGSETSIRRSRTISIPSKQSPAQE